MPLHLFSSPEVHKLAIKQDKEPEQHILQERFARQKYFGERLSSDNSHFKKR